jgi:hypothetical protein
MMIHASNFSEKPRTRRASAFMADNDVEFIFRI